jgi:GTP-binding protein
MKVLNAEFVKSCEQPDQFPHDRLPAVAFVGRSNVGKSSLINSLLRRKGLARVSRTPGKTQQINFFRVTTDDPRARAFHVVDLPGYGYAKVSKAIRARWRPLIDAYLTGSEGLKGIVLLVDSRGTEAQDAAAFDWLADSGRPLVFVATKVDKLTRSERAASAAAIRDLFGLSDGNPLVAYSSVTHEGRDELWGEISTLLSAASATSKRDSGHETEIG